MTTKTSLAAASFLDANGTSADATVKNILLVHGAFADGSGWLDVYRILKGNGYKVTVVQNPTTASLRMSRRPNGRSHSLTAK